MIVLDLMSETDPKYEHLDSYYGQPFIWNMLNNFGGTIALFGNIDFVNEVSVTYGLKYNYTALLSN